LVLDQVSVAVPPDTMLDGDALRVTVGNAAPSTTGADADVVPAGPVQVNEYAVVAVGDSTCVPLMACVPLQPPEARHELTFTADHASVVVPAATIRGGVAVKITNGAPCGSTLSSAVAEADPPAPWQVIT
jgi:hypothetical protein